MGLSISYRFKVKADVAAARQYVRQLHAFARTLPFDSVSDVDEYGPPDGRYEFERVDAGDDDWKPGDLYLVRKRDDGLEETVRVPGLHVMTFRTDVAGSETASFGLASHPPVVLHNEDVVVRRGRGRGRGGEERRLGAGPAVEFPTRLRGWYAWSDCCKTQYAGNPKFGGVENFLRAHVSVFRVLDECKRLGMKTRVRDDGRYWRHRDEGKLIRRLREWDELIAGLVGRLSDAIGDGHGPVVAPIKDRPDFEHLEARGAARRGKQAKGGASSRSARRRPGGGGRRDGEPES
jgi:hypothetical protein